MNTRIGRRAWIAALTAVLVAPAALFFFSALGRSLQPTTREPARTLEAIVTWFGALPASSLLALLVIVPLVGLIVAAGLLVATWSRDESVRADVVDLVRASARVIRHPSLVFTILVVAFGLVYFAAITVHAIAG